MQTNEELEDFMDKTAWTLDVEHHKPGEVFFTFNFLVNEYSHFLIAVQSKLQLLQTSRRRPDDPRQVGHHRRAARHVAEDDLSAIDAPGTEIAQ